MKQKLFTLLFMFLFTFLNYGFGQSTHFEQGFTTTSVPSGWTDNAMYYNTTANHGTYTGANGAGFNRADDWLYTESVNSAGTLSFYIKGSSSPSQIGMKIQKSVDAGSNWTDIVTYPKATFSTTWEFKSIDINDNSSAILIRFFIHDRSGNSIYLDDIKLTDYSSTPTAATPTFSPAAGTYYTSQNVTISTTTPDATIYYTTDGSEPDNTDTEYTAPVTVSSTTSLKAIAYATGVDPSTIGSAVYTFPTIVEVADIATLRGGATDGTIYKLTGEAILTFQTSNRHAKYIQDATDAILIDDSPGNITTIYDVYDGITGIIGTLTTYSNMLQFVPKVDPGAATSTGNTVTPIEVTIDNLTTDYQAKLVKVIDASITGTGNFISGTNYPLTDALGAAVLRVAYNDLDYIGNPIPQSQLNITGVVLQYNSAMQVVPRDTHDIVATPVVPLGTTGIVIAVVLIAVVLVVRKGRLI